MDVVLRNNRTSDEHPFGIFHPHQEVHHVKKENIGLIEVMGLAVLPGRLEGELEKLSQYLLEKTPKENWDESILKHWDWSREILKQYSSINHENIKEIIETEVGRKFQTVLEHAGVFKRTKDGKQAFLHFLKHLEQSVQ